MNQGRACASPASARTPITPSAGFTRMERVASSLRSSATIQQSSRRHPLRAISSREFSTYSGIWTQTLHRATSSGPPKRSKGSVPLRPQFVLIAVYTDPVIGEFHVRLRRYARHVASHATWGRSHRVSGRRRVLHGLVAFRTLLVVRRCVAIELAVRIVARRHDRAPLLLRKQALRAR
jgi:hypothetical protein